MYSLLFAALVSFLATAATVPLVRRLAVWMGAVDQPSARRVHARPIPRMGGMAIAFGFVAAVVLLLLRRTSAAQQLLERPRGLLGLAAGGAVILFTGVQDDTRGMGAKKKLGLQVLAALLVYLGGGVGLEVIHLPILGDLRLGWFGFPLAVLWIVGVINAINLIDGLDGLAAGVSFFACLTLLVTSIVGGAGTVPAGAVLCAALAPAILGFLAHNFHPATIFMGDTGSMFLGYLLATIPLLWAPHGHAAAPVSILVPVLALGLPITDMCVAMVRRFLARRSIFSADRGHIHHRLLDLGLTHRRAVLALYGTSVLFTVTAVLVYIDRSVTLGLALAVVSTLSVGGMWVLRLLGLIRSKEQAQEQADEAASHRPPSLPSRRVTGELESPTGA